MSWYTSRVEVRGVTWTESETGGDALAFRLPADMGRVKRWLWACMAEHTSSPESH